MQTLGLDYINEQSVHRGPPEVEREGWPVRAGSDGSRCTAPTLLGPIATAAQNGMPRITGMLGDVCIYVIRINQVNAYSQSESKMNPSAWLRWDEQLSMPHKLRTILRNDSTGVVYTGI